MVKVKGGKSSKKSINISKGIVYIFFIFYLVVYGIVVQFFIASYQKSHPGELPVYISYLPFACYVGAAFLGLSFLIFIKNVRMPKARETKSRKKVRAGSIYKQALFLIIFVFSFIPLLAPIVDQGKTDQNFSAYNEDWNGGADFMLLLEEEGYDCYNLQSSLSATERLAEEEDKYILLIIFGANQYYNPLHEIPYFIKFFNESNSLLLLHDQGSTSTLLWEIFLANMVDPDVKDEIPLTIFPDGTLRDNESYDTSPEFPVIVDFPSHPITSGIDEVILSQSTAALGGPFVEYSGWDVVGYSSAYSFIDRNDDEMYDYDDDNYDISYILDAVPDFPDELKKIPLCWEQAVFMAKDTGTSRIFVSGDASLFNNELINEDGYDNQKFALNIVEWLTSYENREKDDWIVVFDEAHLRPEESRDLSSAGIFGFILQYVIQLSTNPFTSFMYPVLAVYTLRRYLPKKGKKEEKKIAEQEKEEEKLKFRTSSFFAKKIEWYRDKRKYDKALALIYRRLERKLNSLLGGAKLTTKNVINMVTAKEPGISRHKIRRINKFMDRILSIKAGKSKVRNEREFENLFFEMEWVVDAI